jgi:hypothetical protein
MKELAECIDSQVNTITKFLDLQSLPHPSFKPGAPSALPEDGQVQKARIALIEAANDLILLAQGPGEYIRNEAFVVGIVPTTFPVYANAMTRKSTTSQSSVSLTITTSGIPFPLKVRSLTMTYPRKSAFPPIVFTASSGTQ